MANELLADSAGQAAGPDEWFDTVGIVDDEWVKIGLTTPAGEQVSYLIPRFTGFDAIDNQPPAQELPLQ